MKCYTAVRNNEDVCNKSRSLKQCSAKKLKMYSTLSFDSHHKHVHTQTRCLEGYTQISEHTMTILAWMTNDGREDGN